ncbi:MAG TPA: D-2-hydroxyacid dehydrogenase [Methylomirabilota bacterium]|nr:D-2-hydroxyacid dehydrogenase [Methylomirabilota bacterium]
MKVVVYHRRAAEYVRLIRERCVGADAVAADGEAELREALHDADALLAFQFPVQCLEAGRRLRWLQLTSAGAEHLLPAREWLRGVAVTNSRGIHADVMADYTFGVLVMLHWDFPRLSRNQQARRWEPRSTKPLRGKTLGVVGVGAIGREIARRAPAFGMSVQGVRRSGVPVPEVGRMFGPEGLREMLPSCDFVVLVTPETNETRSLLGERELRAMKRTAYLVNVARGSAVDEGALIRALREGWIAGAALDVFAQEPLPDDHPVWDLSNVIVTPHIAGEPDAYVERVMEIFADNYRRLAAGEPLRNPVDLAQGY